MMPATRRCSYCKRQVPIDKFFYNNKDHKTCCVCAEKRKLPGKHKCQECGKKGCFNYYDQTIGIRCSQHKLPGMVNVTRKRCEKCKKKRPSFGYEREKATHCKDCKKLDMIDVSHNKCIVCKKKIPIFGYMSGKATHCGDCKDENMLDISNPMCIVCKKTRSLFGLEGEKATHCGNCKTPNMIDVKHKKCIVCEKKHPSFGYEGDKTTHCGDCKENDMVNVTVSKCTMCEDKIPTFAYENNGIATHCKDCKELNMVDVKHHKCDICDTRAWYSIPLNQPNRCAQHKEEGMISNPRARCINNECKERAQYGIKKPIHCNEHKDKSDLNLVERKCIKCGKLDIIDKDGICINFCHKEEEYFKIYKKWTKHKEIKIITILKAAFGQATLLDRVIQSVCTDEKVDIIYETDTHVVIVEVDEFQHSRANYCESGEYARMINIVNSYGGKPVIFIRYNPDNFKINGKKTSVPGHVREDILVRWVKYALESKPDKLAQIVYLYYNDYDDRVSSFTELNTLSDIKYSCDLCPEYETYIKGVFNEHKKHHKQRQILTKKKNGKILEVICKKKE